MANSHSIKYSVKEARVEEDSLRDYIYPARAQKVIPILKILLNNQCRGRCFYCANNINSNCQRFSLEPAMLGKYFFSLYKRGEVQGLFVSNAIFRNPNLSQEKILETVIILRKRYHYQGYIHAKVLPGADLALIKRLFDFASRLSINLEFPAQKYLSGVSSKSLLDDLIKRLRFLSKINREKRLSSGITTQFVVGATPASDREYLNLSQYLYRQLHLRRVYYSGFQPISGTPLQNHPPTHHLRIKRLYEADFLIKEYGFSPSDFAYDRNGNLLLDRDVKENFAFKNRDLFPININKADLEELIRIPGIGRERAYRILKLRREAKIASFDRLKMISIPEKSKEWICY
jgi:predicted DNA-binding helix-hairpin-helix protein